MPRWGGATAVGEKNDSLSWQESVDETRRLDELHDAQTENSRTSSAVQTCRHLCRNRPCTLAEDSLRSFEFSANHP